MRVAVGLYQVVVGVVIAGGKFFGKSNAYRIQVDISTCSIQDKRIVITIIHSFPIHYPRGIIYRSSMYKLSVQPSYHIHNHIQNFLPSIPALNPNHHARTQPMQSTRSKNRRNHILPIMRN